MATILLAAAGFSAGASVGGAVLGLSSAVIGQAVGATVGRVIDQQLLGSGSQAIETGKVDRFRVTGASQGTAIARIYGRNRIGGQVIWASRFKETSTTTGGGKGAPRSRKTTHYQYSVSVAIALCEGEITRVGRVWADGVEIARDDLNLRVYAGSQTQLPDPKIVAIEGIENTPAFRGTAYVVLEDLQLEKFGNRIPQFTFEVMRPSQNDTEFGIAKSVQGVAMIPGTGEYALATTPVYYDEGLGVTRPANINNPSGKTDFLTSCEAQLEELPNCNSTSLVVSWFGDDLRCNATTIKPKVEQALIDGTGMPWNVSGVDRSSAEIIPKVDDKSIYGGTPTDQSVLEAIAHLKSKGQDVVFYPFILMDQLAGNGLTDPYTGDADQPALPWRGRITLSSAAGRAGSPDGTVAATSEVDAFFGTAAVSDFVATANGVTYTGPAEWSYRRFILHYAHLCAAAGGVDAFLIGSEMRGLSQIRGAGNSYPAVSALIQLAADVRSILGATTKISYAADWSEYFGYQPNDGSGDRLFHLDPLWADANIDFVGIDNYMPLSDWREGHDHLDASFGSIYSQDYLKSNILGGEGYDYFYHSPESRAAQIRTPITDDTYEEPWVYRYKDIKNWWLNPHHERIGGVRQAVSTPWQPGSKPIWFTEIGCAAVDKGTNQPNKFVDPKSSESSLPRYSNGMKDELIQMEYLRAQFSFWNDPQNNPTFADTGIQMLDMSHAHVWAWDARPFPFFPNNSALWADGENYTRGHWLNGRTAARSLASVVSEVCEASGVFDYDVSKLFGYVRGYKVGNVETARSILQPLMLAFGFDALERGGKLYFKNRTGMETAAISKDELAVLSDQTADVESTRLSGADIANRVRLDYVDAGNEYEVSSAEAIYLEDETISVSQSDTSLVLTSGEAQNIVERWLSESRVAKDTVKIALPLSKLWLGAGDVLNLPAAQGSNLFRIDQVEMSGSQIIEATRIEPNLFEKRDIQDKILTVRPFVPAVPLHSVFLDLPLLTGQENPVAPHIAITAAPWPGAAAVYSSATDSNFELNTLIETASVIGATQTPLPNATIGVKDNGTALRVKISGGTLASVSWDEVLNGANLAVIGDGTSDNWEVFQFENATLVGENTYDLTGRLRGQLGSDGLMPDEWPIGSSFVLLNAAPQQITLLESERNLARHYRIGPSGRDYTDPSFQERIEAFKGNGLRPYAPCHLTWQRNSGLDIQISWIRRTRVGGDSWETFEVPLGESSERYVIRVMNGSTVVREEIVSNPNWIYSNADQTLDSIVIPFQISVAQVSDGFGYGLFANTEITS